jgi:hypothetical protein
MDDPVGEEKQAVIDDSIHKNRQSSRPGRDKPIQILG